MKDLSEERCISCKYWHATDDAGVDLGELAAGYVEALAERKKSR